MLFADIIIHMLYKQKAVLEEEPKMLRYLRGFLVLITAPKDIPKYHIMQAYFSPLDCHES